MIFTITTGKGETLNLADCKGKVIMVVNTATGCGFTPQYVPIEQMYMDFTKFIIDREGNVVARFEPTADMAAVEACVGSLL